MLPVYLAQRTCIFFVILSGMLLTGVRARAQQASFTADVTTGCFPLTVKFTDTSTGNPTGWTWKLGNGNTSTLQHPSAVYSGPGTYNVQLTVAGSGSTVVKNGYITVYDKPTVKFSMDRTSGCSPLPVKFTDESTAGSGSIAQWYWVFGDGATSPEANPTHVYEISGAKTISLKVINQYGCENDLAKGSAIQVQGPTAAFTTGGAVFCQVPALIQFTNQSSGEAPLTYAWAFGDGKTSTQKDPANQYTRADVFKPELTVRDKNGCTSKKTGEVRIGGEGGLTVVPSKSKVCVGETISFTVTNDAPVDTYAWNFGNSTSSDKGNPTVAYSQSGTYTVSLRAQLVGKSCESVVSFPIEVVPDPVPKFTYAADCNYKITFTSTSTSASRVLWEFTDGFVTPSATFSRTYAGPGSHVVKLTAYNALNCSKTVEQTISVPSKPTAMFTPGKEQDCTEPSLSGCAPFTINFVNTSASSTTFTSKWTFGDNTTATTKNASHTYGAGVYTVTLDIKNASGCTSSYSAKVTVSDVTPVAKFTVSKPEVCARETVSFTDQSTNGTFWCWDFGDGGSANVQHPTHSYNEPGTYTVRLTVKNGGCASTFEIKHAVKVKDPFVDFEINKGCANPYQVGLVNLSANYHSLLWDFGDNQTSTANVGSHTYGATGSYVIKLTAKNNTTQCEVKVEKQVAIYDVEADFKVDNVKPCKGAPVMFTDQSDGAVAWNWVFGDGKIDSRPTATTTYDQAGQFHAALTAYDPDGCADTKSVTIDVLNINGNFSFTGVSDCSKLEAAFTDRSTATPPIDEWLWDFGDGHTSGQQHPVNTYTATGSYPVVLTLKNGEGSCTFIRYDAVPFTVPVADFQAVKPGNCMNEPVQFTNLSMNAQNYAWDFGDSRQTATVTHPRIAYAATGSYTVTLKATDQYGCEKTLTRPLYISVTKPVAAFAAQETHAECPPLTPVFQDQSTGNVVSWRWNSGDDQLSTLQAPAFTYLKPGEFDVTLVVTDNHGCSDTTVAPKLIRVGGPYGHYMADGPGPFCVNDAAAFLAQTTNAVNHRWDFGDGVVHDQPEMNALHRYGQPGVYHIALVLTDALGCEVVADGQVELHVLDTAKASALFAPCIFTGEESLFAVDQGQADLVYTWTVDGELLGTGAEMPVTIHTPGLHHVVLGVVTPPGCDSETAYEVPVQGDVVFVPNVFTPNVFDNLNSAFEVVGVERSTWDLKVFNRWGESVFEQRDYKNNWNASGLASGVYYYLLQNAVCPGREYKGVVSVIR